MFMLKIDIIDYKTKSSSLIFQFILIMTNKSIIAGNIGIFINLNMNQLGLIKDNPQFDKFFYIC